MKIYCVSCMENNANKNSSVRKTKQKSLTLISNFIVCGRENQLLLKIKKSTISITFEMISLK